MVFKQITWDNLESEHICCCIADKKGENCVASKKAWLRERIEEGLVFYKLDVRGKVFIEYIPAEYAWAPVEAEGYMYINCLWVSGQYKGHGYGDQLLEHCIEDSKRKGKKGLVCLSAKKKMPFLSDPKYLKYKEFRLVDTAEPYFELYYLPFEGGTGEASARPCIREGAKRSTIDEKGFVLYFTNQCPHTEKYAPILASLIESYGMECKLCKIESGEAARSAPVPAVTYALFYNGTFVTNEILSEKSFAKLWDKIKE